MPLIPPRGYNRHMRGAPVSSILPARLAAMSPAKVTSTSRPDIVYLARVADQAERYHDVVAQLKVLINLTDGHLSVDERNLLSIAYKNITATFRTSWRTIDTLQREIRHATRQQQHLMSRQKELIEQDLIDTCKDVVGLLEQSLIPAASPGEEKVFYGKMRGDYYRYWAEMTRDQVREHNATTSLEAYKLAYKHAIATLEAVHPTRLGLALNFAVYYHDICRSPERACFLAKHAFDEAIAAATEASFPSHGLEDSFMILQLLKDDLLLWSEEMRN